MEVRNAPEVAVDARHVQTDNDVVVGAHCTAETVGLDASQRNPSTRVVFEHVVGAAFDCVHVIGGKEEFVIVSERACLVVFVDSFNQIRKAERLAEFFDGVGLCRPTLANRLVDFLFEVVDSDSLEAHQQCAAHIGLGSFGKEVKHGIAFDGVQICLVDYSVVVGVAQHLLFVHESFAALIYQDVAEQRQIEAWVGAATWCPRI